jgi:hypothetical protein
MPVGALAGGLSGSLGSAAIIGGATLGSALIGSSAAQRAASIQARAAQQSRADMMPFMIPGQGAMASLAQLYGINPQTGAYNPNDAFSQASLQAFQRSPDYQFAFQQGLNALQNSRAAQGMLRSGNTLQGITQFGQGLASQQFGNYRSALQQLAGIGAGAAGGAGQMAQQAGAATASGIVGGANAWSGALGSLGNYAMMQQQQQQQQAFLQNQQQQQQSFLAGLYRPSSYTGTSPPSTLSSVPGLSASTSTVYPGGGAFF